MGRVRRSMVQNHYCWENAPQRVVRHCRSNEVRRRQRKLSIATRPRRRSGLLLSTAWHGQELRHTMYSLCLRSMIMIHFVSKHIGLCRISFNTWYTYTLKKDSLLIHDSAQNLGITLGRCAHCAVTLWPEFLTGFLCTFWFSMTASW